MCFVAESRVWIKLLRETNGLDAIRCCRAGASRDFVTSGTGAALEQVLGDAHCELLGLGRCALAFDGRQRLARAQDDATTGVVLTAQ